MSKNKSKNNIEEEPTQQTAKTQQQAEETPEKKTEGQENETEEEDDAARIASLTEQLEKEKKEYLFLMAEFDNFRKRTMRDKAELIKNAAESAFIGILPIVDDMERGLKASAAATDAAPVREGMKLIYDKLVKLLEKNGVKAIDTADTEFDTERHEAISTVPVPDPEMKGKIIDTVEKGYTLNDKVIRHAKVVVGQ
ncbi:MAG TPA: nucleotide exchange factor GrpE [Porphyromonadaceae bacterium]|nr:nucleotide exchange factor GrpE [Porphyromonadaceae bacterium]